MYPCGDGSHRGLLEAGVEYPERRHVRLVLANAAHIKNVPGRKTDMNDAMWIADLLSCGLIKASFVPEQEIQELRSLLRARKQLTREQTSHIQRIQKTLEEANIKLNSVISDIMGVSGRRMIEAMINGVRNPFKLAKLADRQLKASRKQLYDALHGRLTDHHRFMLELYLQQYDALADAAKIDKQVDAAIARMDAEVAAGQAPFRSLIDLLCTIPGVGKLAAKTILAEIGTDMSRFPTDLCRGRFDAHCNLPHAQGRHRTPRSRCGPLRSPFHRNQSQAPGRPDRQARLPGRASSAARSRMTSTHCPGFFLEPYCCVLAGNWDAFGIEGCPLGNTGTIA